MLADPARTPEGLSVFFPAYNDSGTIASMVIRTVKTASELTPDFEIIVVDDGSADGPIEPIRSPGKRAPSSAAGVERRSRSSAGDA